MDACRNPDPPARRVLVLGGGGFIGRYAVAALLAGAPVRETISALLARPLKAE